MADESKPFFPELIPKYGIDPETGNSPLDSWDIYDKVVGGWTDAAYEEAKAGVEQDEEAAAMSKYVDYLLGKQWPPKRPSYRSSPVDNRTWELFWELVSLLTDIRPIAEAHPNDPDDPSLAGQAIVINRCIRSWWLNQNVDMAWARTVIYAMFGSSYVGQIWDSTLWNGLGDLKPVPLGVLDLLPLNPGPESIQQAEAVILQRVVTLNYLRDRFKRGSLVPADQTYSTYGETIMTPKGMTDRQFEMISPQMRHHMGAKSGGRASASPRSLYREFWIKDSTVNESRHTVPMGTPGAKWSYLVKPGQKFYPRGRLIIKGGPIILYDGPNHYMHALFPFSDLRFNAFPWKFFGISDLRSWIPLNDILNNIMAAVIDLLKKQLNPPFMAPMNAFTPSQWQSMDFNMPGQRTGYNAAALMGGKPEYGPVPQMPAFALPTLEWVGRRLDRMSGVAAISEAVSRKQIPGQETLEEIQKTLQTPLRYKSRTMEITMRDQGSQLIYNILQWYDKMRRFLLLGENGKIESMDQKMSDLVPTGSSVTEHGSRFSFIVEPGSLLNYDRDKRALKAFRLRSQKDLSRRTLYKVLDMGIDAATETEELQQEQQREIDAMIKAKTMAAIGAGQGAPG